MKKKRKRREGKWAKRWTELERREKRGREGKKDK